MTVLLLGVTLYGLGYGAAVLVGHRWRVLAAASLGCAGRWGWRHRWVAVDLGPDLFAVGLYGFVVDECGRCGVRRRVALPRWRQPTPSHART